MDEKKFKEIAMEVQEEWQMGGLADTIYEDYALEIFKRYMRLHYSQCVAPKCCYNS